MDTQVRPSLIELCDRWLLLTGRGLMVIAMLLLGVMTILISIQVASRNFFNIGLPWADELARFTGLAVVFFTVPILQYQGRHIAVDMFSNRLSGLASTIMRCINEAVVLGFCILLLMSFADFLKRAAHFSTPAMGMPNWLLYAPAVLGIITCTLITVLRLVHSLTGRNMDPPNEPSKIGDCA